MLSRRALVALAFTLRVISPAVVAAQPQVTKVEPPNWWSGHTWNPVRVLIRGTGLQGARVESAGEGIDVGLVRSNAPGTYLFVDLQIDPAASPGPRRIRITTAAGITDAPFDITSSLPRVGRFQGFRPDDVIYQLMPDRFRDGDASNDDPASSRGLFDRTKPRYYHGGDFKGILEKLPYLKDLGVTALWLTPWYDNVNHLNEKEPYDNLPITDYHGYGAVDFYGVEEHFGTMSELSSLVEAAHRLGLKVIQDQVANHSGPYHPWVDDPPTPTWFNGTAARHAANTWQTWTLQDPHASPQVQRETLQGWFIDILPDLNQDDDEVARYIIQNSLWWVGELGLDGIRQDTWPYVPRAFWQRWMEALKQEYPELTVVGELYDSDPAIVSFFSGGAVRSDGVDTKVDSLFDFPLLSTLRRAFAEGKTIREVAQMLARDHLYPDAARLVVFLGNHDMPRFMNEPGATTAGLKLAQTFILTTRGIPQVYYGDEIALAGAADPDNRRSMPGAFAGDARDAFTEAGRTTAEEAVFEHLRRVIHLRQDLEPLRRGTLQQLYVADQQYVFARTTAGASVIVAFNNDAKPATWSVDVSGTHLVDGAVLQDRLGGIADVAVEKGRITVTLAARSAAILTDRRLAVGGG
jgi:glycosidase